MSGLPNPPLEKPTLIIGEGSDEACLLQVMRDANLLKDADIIAIGYSKRGNGKQALGHELEAQVIGLRRLQRLLLVMDADDSIDDEFKNIVNAIKGMNDIPNVAGIVSVPDKPFELFQTAQIAVGVYLMPGPGRKGCLDTLVLETLNRLRPDSAACTRAFVNCASPAMNESKLHKAMVRAHLAMVHTADPACPLSKLWRKSPELVPPDSAEFDHLRNTLNSWIA